MQACWSSGEICPLLSLSPSPHLLPGSLQRTNLLSFALVWLLLKSGLWRSPVDISPRRILAVSACSNADLVTRSKNVFRNHKLFHISLPGSLKEKTQHQVKNHRIRGKEENQWKRQQQHRERCVCVCVRVCVIVTS